MKKISCFVLAIALMLVFASCGTSPAGANNGVLKVLTDFQPMYILTLNIAKGVKNVDVKNMTSSTTGCLDQYNITTADIKKVAACDMIITNGAGLESFVPQLKSTKSNLTIVDASAGIQLMENTTAANPISGTTSVAQETAPVGSNFNAHVWMLPANAKIQASNIRDALIKADPSDTAAFNSNYTEFAAVCDNVDTAYHEVLDNAKNKKVVITHEPFEYIANYYGITIAYTLLQEPNDQPSAKSMEDAINIIKLQNVPIILVEPSYSNDIANTLARETGANVVEMNSFVSGDVNADSYRSIMMSNLETLKAYLK